MLKLILLGLLVVSGLCGCTVVSANRVFPKLDWYWSRDAKEQRRERAEQKRFETKEHTVTPAPAVLPNPQLTPGIVDTNVTIQMLRSPAFIKSRRHVSEAMKKEVFRRYGVPWSDRRHWEVDHYIPLCGGGDNSVSNLWLEAWSGPYGAHAKDRLEMYLHRKTLKGEITLQQMQAAFLDGPWTNAYNRAGFKPGFKQRVFSITHRPVK